jgi:hypothetical protein
MRPPSQDCPHSGASESEVTLMVPQIPGGLVVSLVGIINGAINGIVPQLYALLSSLGIAPPA